MNGDISDQQLDEILARCNATTAQPWKSCVEGRDHESDSDFIMTGMEQQRGNDIELFGTLKQLDQDFIVSAKRDIPILVNEIRTLKKLLVKIK